MFLRSKRLPQVAYMLLVLIFISAWCPLATPSSFSVLLVTILLEFYVIQFVAFYMLYAQLYARPEQKLSRHVIALLGVFLFSIGLAYSYGNWVMLFLPWLLFYVRLQGMSLDAAEDGLRRVYICFRWIFDLSLYVLLALVLLFLPVPDLYLEGVINNLGFITAGPWVEAPQLAAAQGVFYFLVQLLLYVNAQKISNWLDSISSR